MDALRSNVFEKIRFGTVTERRRTIRNLSIKKVKTLINIIGTIIENQDYGSDDETILTRYTSTFRKLLDKKVPLKEKKELLQKAGHVYLPIFLNIIGPNTSNFAPKERKRVSRDCPICNSKNLKKLSNHLKQVHDIHDRKDLLKQAKEK